MRITKLTYINHDIMGDTVIDFTKSDGTPYNTIVLAGENGNGKTTILETISSIASGKLTPSCSMELVFNEKDGIELLKYDSELADGQRQYDGLTGVGVVESIEHVVLSSSDVGWSAMQITYTEAGQRKTVELNRNAENRSVTAVERFFLNLVVKYKKNDQEPQLSEISSTTKLTIDSHDGDNGSGNKLIFANRLNVSELLVNINSQDANEVQQRLRDGERDLTEDDAENRVKRFRHAFSAFFDNQLKFKQINNFDITFEKAGREFPITKLSSGEKTIVQYGAFLLKDKNIGETFITLLDEPEQSLHPKWEEKILTYYRDILTDDTDTQLSQIFATTHSEYVIKNAYSNDDLIIVLKRDSTGKITADTTRNLDLFPFSPTYDEIKFGTFNLPTPEFHDEMFGYLQEYHRKNVKALDNLLISGTSCPQKHWIGKQMNNGVIITSTSLNTESLAAYIRNYTHHPELRESDNSAYSETELAQSIEYLIAEVNKTR